MEYGPVPYDTIEHDYAYAFYSTPCCMSLTTGKKTKLDIPGKCLNVDVAPHGVFCSFDTGLYHVVDDQVILIDCNSPWVILWREATFNDKMNNIMHVYHLKTLKMEYRPLSDYGLVKERNTYRALCKDFLEEKKRRINAQTYYISCRDTGKWLCCATRDKIRAEMVLEKEFNSHMCNLVTSWL